MIKERHAFLPPRPGGTTCVRVRTDIAEYCGYPAAHPIHGPLNIDLSPKATADTTVSGAQLRADLLRVARFAATNLPESAKALIEEIVHRYHPAP